MILDSRSLPRNAVVDTDVCIVGAGAAGITLAREFLNQPFNVCLVESGAERLDRTIQSLSQGDNAGIPYYPLDECRQRALGGTTHLWMGWCAPFEEMDFEEREWVPFSGWPFPRSALVPFYERAQRVCQIGPFVYDVGPWETPERPRLPFLDERIITKTFQFSPPTRFGTVYRDELARAGNLKTLLHGTAVELEATESAGQVARLHVASSRDHRFAIAAKVFILAAGGIETPQLLLLSNRVHKAGLGNQNDQVGRCFMEHPYCNTAAFVPADRNLHLGMYFPHTAGPASGAVRMAGTLAIAPATLSREKIENCVFFFPGQYKVHADFQSYGVRSLFHVFHAVRQGALPSDFAKRSVGILRDVHKVFRTGMRMATESRRRSRERWILRSFLEAGPNPDSRVTLSERHDALGRNRVRLDWRPSELDRRSWVRAHEIVDEELRRSRLGRLHMTSEFAQSTWPPSVDGGCHHAGTTRMHVDPRRGVVDEHCRVHGIENLFIAGPSVFPTSGSANPMLTIVALALRLADRVKGILRAPPSP
jgi:choline dehydrogenase-like flavoprotein